MSMGNVRENMSEGNVQTQMFVSPSTRSSQLFNANQVTDILLQSQLIPVFL